MFPQSSKLAFYSDSFGWNWIFKYLKQQYATLTDDALLDIHREELVPTARKLLDSELQRRKIAGFASPNVRSENRQQNRMDAVTNSEEQPDWIYEAATVLTSVVMPGQRATDEAPLSAEAALIAANIPRHLELSPIADEPETTVFPTHQWSLLVPGKLNLRATSVLDKAIFNVNFEADWKAHLAELFDDELHEMKPQIAFAGLIDKIDRATRAYEDELARRTDR